MRKKGCYHKNRPFRLLVAAALRFVQSYLNDIAALLGISKNGVLYCTRQKILRRSVFVCGGGVYFVMMTNSDEPPGPVMVSTVSSLTFVKVRMPSAPFVTVQLVGF